VPDIVGKESDMTGPFQMVHQRFHKCQVIPLTAGWFGEIRKDFKGVTKLLAREAAAGDDGMTVSPLVNTDRKGGAYVIMLQQFRQAIGVAIAQGNAEHKTPRLHCVRATAEEAKAQHAGAIIVTTNAHRTRTSGIQYV